MKKSFKCTSHFTIPRAYIVHFPGIFSYTEKFKPSRVNDTLLGKLHKFSFSKIIDVTCFSWRKFHTKRTTKQTTTKQTISIMCQGLTGGNVPSSTPCYNTWVKPWGCSQEPAAKTCTNLQKSQHLFKCNESLRRINCFVSLEDLV